MPAACAEARLVILAAAAAAPDGCTLIAAETLARTGALAIYLEGDGLRTVAVRDTVGRRPWNSQ